MSQPETIQEVESEEIHDEKEKSFAKDFLDMIQKMVSGEPLVISTMGDLCVSQQWVMAALTLSATLQNEHYKSIMSRLDDLEARLDNLDKD